MRGGATVTALDDFDIRLRPPATKDEFFVPRPKKPGSEGTLQGSYECF
jgi:hypothetical protein